MSTNSFLSQKNTLAGFFFISLSMLIFELLISRVMSAVAFYHFAFMAICLAMFGITVGAVIVHIFKTRLAVSPSKSLYYSALIFSAAIFVNLLCVSQLKSCYLTAEFTIIPIPWNLSCIFVSIAIPFIACGICLSMIFEHYAQHANKIYFIDLIGASLGCLLFIPAINFFGVVNSYFLIIFFCLIAANLFRSGSGKLNKKHFLLLSAIFLSFMGMHLKTNMLDLQWIKGSLNDKYFFKQWNSYSYIRLLYDGKNIVPRGWSFAPNKYPELFKTRVEQLSLDIDGGAGTAMTNFENRDLKTVQFLAWDITSLPYHLITDGDTLVIGVGAGRDILTGLLFNQRSIIGVEINKTILNIHRTVAAKFAGDLSRHPKVTLINNEARSYINASNKKFDIIQISLIDTFAATQAGAYALSENNLYTTEAIETYLDHLTDRGILSISYWTYPYILKIVGSATYALDKRGVKEPIKHYILIHSDTPRLTNGVANFLVKKTPFTMDEVMAVGKYCEEMGYHFVLSAQGTPSVELSNMVDMRFLEKYVKNFALNIEPATDDKPFFFITSRINFFKTLKEFKLLNVNDADQILVCLFVIMLVLTLIFVIVPLIGMTRNTTSEIPVFPFAVYFTSIGLAFMFVEMTQITRLSSFLGHPTYSLALALFTFLFGSGIGSLCLGSSDNHKILRFYTTLFIGICIVSGIFTSPFLHHCSKFPIEIRMIIAVATLFPLAFFMGTFLPQGMKLLSRKKSPVALFWGLNGAASVLGSILAMIIQIQFGLNLTFNIGVWLYIVAVLLLFFLQKKCLAGDQHEKRAG